MENGSFLKYMNDIDALLWVDYGITITDAGIELDEIAGAQEDQWTPKEWVEWFAEKYDLTPRSEFTLKMAKRVFGCCNWCGALEFKTNLTEIDMNQDTGATRRMCPSCDQEHTF